MINPELHLPLGKDIDLIKRQLTVRWREMAQEVNNLLTLYVQTIQPVTPVNTVSLWQDTGSSPNKYYLVANFGGTYKKVELT